MAGRAVFVAVFLVCEGLKRENELIRLNDGLKFGKEKAGFILRSLTYSFFLFQPLLKVFVCDYTSLFPFSVCLLTPLLF